MVEASVSNGGWRQKSRVFPQGAANAPG